MFSVADSNVYSDTHEMNTHIHSLKTQVMNTRVHSVDTWIETNLMLFTFSNYTWFGDAYTYVYSVFPANRMRLCVHTSMHTSGFLQVVPHTQCVWWTSTNPSCVASKYSVLRTTSIDLRSHCVWHLTCTVPLSPSHCVVYLTHTVFLKSVLLLPSLSLAQCTRSTYYFIPRITT